MINAVSLFSGCGGFDYGLTSCGVNIIWANDINRAAASAYKSIFPDTEFVLDDIHNIRNFPSAEILIGCYPCTGFSEAAKRRWKDGNERDLKANPKNFLFQEFLRAIDQVQPKFIFIENVRGMLSASNGFFIKQQIEGLKGRGFNRLAYKLLNAEEYGLPQSRQRVLIVGIHDSVDPALQYSFPDPTHGPNRVNPYKTLYEAIGHLPEWPEGEFFTRKFHGHYLTRNRKRGWNEPSFTIVANASHTPLHPMGEKMVKIGVDKWALQGSDNRRLSWKECAVIQGLPELIQIDARLESKYMVVGNAVPPLLAKVVAKPIVDFLNQR